MRVLGKTPFMRGNALAALSRNFALLVFVHGSEAAL
jgi:hypothetical protein